MAAWKLPVIVAALTLPIIAGFLAVGPALGVAAGALAVLALLVVAARQRPRGPIGSPDVGERRRVLIVVTAQVEDPAAIDAIAHAAELDRSEEGDEILVLAPARIGFLDRWASDVEGARQVAQQSLVVTVAALAKAGIAAEARVGDEDVVQAIEDQLQSFAASEVVLVSQGAGDDEGVDAAAAELDSRLRAGFRHVRVGTG